MSESLICLYQRYATGWPGLAERTNQSRRCVKESNGAFFTGSRRSDFSGSNEDWKSNMLNIGQICGAFGSRTLGLDAKSEVSDCKWLQTPAGIGLWGLLNGSFPTPRIARRAFSAHFFSLRFARHPWSKTPQSYPAHEEGMTQMKHTGCFRVIN